MNTHDMEISKVNLDCAKSDLINLRSMIIKRIETYQTLENMSEGTVQNYLFEVHLDMVLANIERNVTDVFYRIPDIEENEN